MKISGFTIIRNAVKYDYPIIASITSILPICTEFIVAVGNSDDRTLALIQSIASPKIKILETQWDDDLRTGGRVLAVETDKALDAISNDADWCFYLQADEVIHEDDLQSILTAMTRYRDVAEVDGLLFKYLHFYGSYRYIGTDPSLYKREIRVIRNNNGIYSYRDAQGFRKGINEKLRVKEIDACVYHYGYVKTPIAMQKKHEDFGRLWNNEPHEQKDSTGDVAFNYKEHPRPLSLFTGTHPAVMQQTIESQDWNFEPDNRYKQLSLKQRIKKILEEQLGLNLSYTNYKLIR